MVPRKDIMHFSRQLGVFVQAGRPDHGGPGRDRRARRPTSCLQQVLYDMIERLQAGDTFASAAAAHPEAFPNYYIGILSSAELTGNLDIVLDQLADYLERDIEARSKITSALVYPAVVAVMAVVVVVILATFVMPKFVVFFKSFNAKLPLPTRMLLGVSNFVSHWWWAILAVVVIAVVGIIATASIAGPARRGSTPIILQAPDPRRPGADGDHRADVPDPLLHAQGRRRAPRGDAGDGRIGEQRGLPRAASQRSARR